tara:strand:- start:21536 stop:21652 length:117 start_codon:yes stop_codon:yes gene_type:complete
MNNTKKRNMFVGIKSHADMIHSKQIKKIILAKLSIHER